MLDRRRDRTGAAAAWTTVVVALLAVALAAPAAAQSGLEIMKEQTKRHRVGSEEFRVKLTLVDPSGKQKERELTVLQLRDQAGLSKGLIKFLSPPDIRNTGLLTWEQPGDKDDDQWLFLPATKTAKPVASSSKKNPFMGTDLAFEDLRAEDLDAHTYTVLREEDLGGQKCWVVEAVPATDKEKLQSGYGKRTLWVRKDIYMTVQAEFYNQSGKLTKRATFSDFANVGGDAWRFKTARWETLDSKTTTLWAITEDKVNVKIDENLLTQQGMMRPVT